MIEYAESSDQAMAAAEDEPYFELQCRYALPEVVVLALSAALQPRTAAANATLHRRILGRSSPTANEGLSFAVNGSRFRSRRSNGFQGRSPSRYRLRTRRPGIVELPPTRIAYTRATPSSRGHRHGSRTYRSGNSRKHSNKWRSPRKAGPPATPNSASASSLNRHSTPLYPPRGTNSSPATGLGANV